MLVPLFVAGHLPSRPVSCLPNHRALCARFLCRSNKVLRTDGLRQTCILSQSGWQSPNQGVSRVGSSGGSEGKCVPGILPTLWWLPAILGVPWFVDTVSVPRFTWHSPLSFSVSKFPSSHKDTSHWIRTHLIQYNLILI